MPPCVAVMLLFDISTCQHQGAQLEHERSGDSVEQVCWSVKINDNDNSFFLIFLLLRVFYLSCLRLSQI